MPLPSQITVINILTPIIPIYTTNSPGIFYYYCSSPILHIAPLSFFQPRLIRTPCAVPHLRLVLGVGATHLLLYDIIYYPPIPIVDTDTQTRISIHHCSWLRFIYFQVLTCSDNELPLLFQLLDMGTTHHICVWYLQISFKIWFNLSVI